VENDGNSIPAHGSHETAQVRFCCDRFPPYYWADLRYTGEKGRGRVRMQIHCI
jgi:hypothetical protein